MANSSFASLTAGLLARKGEARPSAEPKFGSRPWKAPITPPPQPPVERVRQAAAQAPVAQPAHPDPHGVKTTIRLTHAQARAVRLAALVLDRPQQDILSAGLLTKLEALACADLANCACFKQVVEGLKKS